jgi:hypothetical protein
VFITVYYIEKIITQVIAVTASLLQIDGKLQLNRRTDSTRSIGGIVEVGPASRFKYAGYGVIVPAIFQVVNDSYHTRNLRNKLLKQPLTWLFRHLKTMVLNPVHGK